MPILQLETYVLEIWKSLGSGVPLTEVIPEGETLQGTRWPLVPAGELRFSIWHGRNHSNSHLHCWELCCAFPTREDYRPLKHGTKSSFVPLNCLCHRL